VLGAEHSCAPVTHIDINRNVGEFHVSDANPVQYFSFDLPEFASQLFFRVNKSSTQGAGMLVSNVRPHLAVARGNARVVRLTQMWDVEKGACSRKSPGIKKLSN
jgi:hypothetical protein